MYIYYGKKSFPWVLGYMDREIVVLEDILSDEIIADVAENEAGDSFVCGVHEDVFKPFQLLGAERVARRIAFGRAVAGFRVVLPFLRRRIP